MLSVLQYLTYITVGGWLLFWMTLSMIYGGKLYADANLSKDFEIGFLLLTGLLSFVLASYASGLSFFFPRVASVIAVALVMPAFVGGIAHIILVGKLVEDVRMMFVPVIAAIIVSICALIWNDSSPWSRQKKTSGKVAVGIFAALPVLPTVYLLGLLAVFIAKQIGGLFLR